MNGFRVLLTVTRCNRPVNLSSSRTRFEQALNNKRYGRFFATSVRSESGNR